MTKPKRYKRCSSEFKREALLRASEEGMTNDIHFMLKFVDVNIAGDRVQNPKKLGGERLGGEK